jgi:phospholipase D1/2
MTAIDKSVLKTVWHVSQYKRTLVAVLLVFLCILAASWRFFSLDEWIEADKLVSLIQSLRASSLAPLIVITTYVIGGIVVFPVIILIPLTALAFGPLLGCFYSLIGLFANASALYAIGHRMGYKTVQQLSGSRIHHLSQQLSCHSFLTMATLRFLPVAPFTVISLIAGASHIRYRKYIAGTLLGISPSIAILTLVGNQIERTIDAPGSQSLIVVILGSSILLLAALWLRQLRAVR